MRTLNKVELAEFNGKDGKPAYVGYNGKVYDVTSSDLWEDGEHELSHMAGADLTSEMEDAPHGEELVKIFPVVGELVKER